ncbi:thermonuclease family protein [Magnetospirillum sp. SS-4]|uniref:thermonuclease family protein n=1 Tax=Magnetospirillum sp. SS-4 TaxID=2681465 RepID=UPI00137FF874|nr:thermonuclease family protein [Magnetospirillum sp. SS-4]CAA7616826.1 Micrococcal nuclease-like protein [Magnetospirillum sp. SS-4]
MNARIVGLVLFGLALVPSPVLAAPMRCPEDAEGGACVWGRVEGFDGATLQIRGLSIALAGVVAPSRKDICANRSTREEFACGRPARKRMAELVAKGIACDIVEVESGQLWGRCRGPDGDVARLLIQAGVVKASKDGLFEDAQKQAVKARKGLWAAEIILPRDWEAVRRKNSDD